MTNDTIDPVSQPSAYQKSLLDLLGDRDPAEVEAATPAQVRQLVADAGPHLRTRPADGEWSGLELVGHIVDAELEERGPESCELTVRLLAGHDLFHLDQARHTLATVRQVEEAR